MSSCNCTGLRPPARISPARGREILPSGRTTTLREISGSFHTFTARRSSGPITYSSLAPGVLVLVLALFGGPPATHMTPIEIRTRMIVTDFLEELIDSFLHAIAGVC